MSKSSQLKWGSFLSYIQMGIGILIGVIYTPVMIRLLGKSEYGLYNTVSSTISMLSILSLGFNSSYIRYFSKYKKNNDFNSIYALNGLFLIIFLIIGAIAFLCGIFFTNNLEIIFKDGLSEKEYQIAKVLMLLLTFNLSISFPMSVFQNIISANEKFVFLKIIGILKTVLSPMITLPLLLSGYKSIVMVVVSVGINLLADVLYFIFVKYKLNNKFFFSNFERGIMWDLTTFTVFIAINMIIDQINWNIDKLLLTRYKGTESVAIYSVGYSLYQYYNMFSTSISSVFTTRIHRICNQFKDNIKERNFHLTNLFIKVGRIQFLLLSLVASGIVIFGKSFIHYWAGDGYEDSYYVAILLILPASIALIQNLGIEIQRAENKHQFRSFAYSIMAIFNLIISVFLCQVYGAIGSAIGTAISLILANGIVMNIYYYRRCGINIPLFWKNIFRQSLGLIIPILFGILFINEVEINSIWKLFIGIIVYSIVYSISIYIISMNKFEKDLILKPLTRCLNLVLKS